MSNSKALQISLKLALKEYQKAGQLREKLAADMEPLEGMLFEQFADISDDLLADKMLENTQYAGMYYAYDEASSTEFAKKEALFNKAKEFLLSEMATTNNKQFQEGIDAIDTMKKRVALHPKLIELITKLANKVVVEESYNPTGTDSEAEHAYTVLFENTTGINCCFPNIIPALRNTLDDPVGGNFETAILPVISYLKTVDDISQSTEFNPEDNFNYYHPNAFCNDFGDIFKNDPIIKSELWGVDFLSVEGEPEFYNTLGSYTMSDIRYSADSLTIALIYDISYVCDENKLISPASGEATIFVTFNYTDRKITISGYSCTVITTTVEESVGTVPVRMLETMVNSLENHSSSTIRYDFSMVATRIDYLITNGKIETKETAREITKQIEAVVNEVKPYKCSVEFILSGKQRNYLSLNVSWYDTEENDQYGREDVKVFKWKSTVEETVEEATAPMTPNEINTLITVKIPHTFEALFDGEDVENADQGQIYECINTLMKNNSNIFPNENAHTIMKIAGEISGYYGGYDLKPTIKEVAKLITTKKPVEEAINPDTGEGLDPTSREAKVMAKALKSKDEEFLTNLFFEIYSDRPKDTFNKIILKEQNTPETRKALIDIVDEEVVAIPLMKKVITILWEAMEPKLRERLTNKWLKMGFVEEETIIVEEGIPTSLKNDFTIQVTEKEFYRLMKLVSGSYSRSYREGTVDGNPYLDYNSGAYIAIYYDKANGTAYIDKKSLERIRESEEGRTLLGS